MIFKHILQLHSIYYVDINNILETCKIMAESALTELFDKIIDKISDRLYQNLASNVFVNTNCDGKQTDVDISSFEIESSRGPIFKKNRKKVQL
jgi:hypothetical protein